MCKFWVSIMFSLLAIIVSGVAIAVTLPRMELGIDYMGVIVAVLALLMTLIVGWNIFTALDFKKDVISRIEESRKASKTDLQQHSALNKKDFENILEAMKRCERFCNKLDEAVELLQQKIKN